MTNAFELSGAASGFIEKLDERNIKDPTAIQKKIIPLLNENKNVFFSSATGTGKTFAYLLPVLGKLLDDNGTDAKGGIRFLIIAPTLELSTQIKDEIDFLLEGTSQTKPRTLNSALAIGSVKLDRQIEMLKKTRPCIIAGNLNRILVLARKGIINLNNLQFLVFDEADRLISGEMLEETNELCDLLKRKLKNQKPVIAACSATLNKKCREKLFSVLGELSGPGETQFVESDDHEILREKIEHWAVFSEKRRRDQTLRSFLAAVKAKKSKIKVLVFTNRGDEAAMTLSRLAYHHVNAAGLFGKTGMKALSGEERKAALDAFRKGSIEALVSTDLAARGLDIPGITHVVSLDVPDDSDVYIHRCGRTARAGKKGVMVTIGDETQMRLLASLEKKLKIKIYPKELHYGKICAPVMNEEEEDF